MYSISIIEWSPLLKSLSWSFFSYPARANIISCLQTLCADNNMKQILLQMIFAYDYVQVNFCPEAAHATCPSNGRKGSYSPIEARARFFFKMIHFDPWSSQIFDNDNRWFWSMLIVPKSFLVSQKLNLGCFLTFNPPKGQKSIYSANPF